MKTDPYSTGAIAKHFTDSIDNNSSRAKRAMRRKATPKKKVVIKAKKVSRRMAMALGYMGRVWTPDGIELAKAHKKAKMDGLDPKKIVKDITKDKIISVEKRIADLRKKYCGIHLEGKKVVDVYEKVGRIDRALQVVEAEMDH